MSFGDSVVKPSNVGVVFTWGGAPFQPFKKQTMTTISDQMATLTQRTSLVIGGVLPALYVSGPAGVGKNIAIRAACDSAGIEPISCNPASYLDLLDALTRACRKNVPVWLDEADVIFRSDRSLNLLKIATTDQKRDRVFNGRRVDARVIVSTNARLDRYDWMPTKLRDHAKALFSRSTPICISEDRGDLIHHSLVIAEKSWMMWNDSKGDGIPRYTRAEAIDWYNSHANRLKSPSPRTLKNVASYMNHARLGRLSDDITTSILDDLLEPCA